MKPRKGRIRFTCPACNGHYQKRCRVIDRRRRCPLCKAMAVPILMEARNPKKMKLSNREYPPEREPREWIPGTWGKHYNEYMHSSSWEAVRQLVLKRDGRLCRTCTVPGSHVHHITYRRFGQESLYDLVTLCAPCHVREHELYRLRDRESHWRKQNEVLAEASRNCRAGPSRFTKGPMDPAVATAPPRTPLEG